MKQWIVALVLLVTASAFAKDVHKENHPYGRYIYDGDIPLLTAEQKIDFMLNEFDDKLIVSTIGDSVYEIWGETERMNLSYCISDEFGETKQSVIDAFLVATADWMSAGNVVFSYKAEEDANCNEFNNEVVFDVRPSYGERFLARAFFPSYPRKYRNVIVNDMSFQFSQESMEGFIRHELGHVLGFRHEHISEDSKGICDEDDNFDPLTEYDSSSVMHYPHCGGTGNIRNLVLTDLDREGMQQVYPF